MIPAQDIRQIPYLIYSLCCVITALINVKNTYLKNK